MLVDTGRARLTRHYPITTTTTATNCCYSDSVDSCNATFGHAGENGHISDVDDGLRTSASGAVFVGRPLSVACRLGLDAASTLAARQGGFQHHMAGLMSDMASCDPDDYRPKHAMPPPASAGPGRLLAGGGLCQRSASKSMLHAAAASTSSRARGGAVLAKSCGSALLQRAAVAPSTSAAARGHSAGRSPAWTARSRGSTVCGPHHQSSARVAGVRSSLSLSSSRLSDVDDSRSAGRVPSYLALDDHRYTLRVPPPPNPHPPPSKIQKTGSRASGMRQSASSGSLVGVTSILEAFLRTTRPMDPNKGSNAALAAAGL